MMGNSPAGDLMQAACGLTVKIRRAHGGCLGIKSRRRTWTAAISRG
jgi:hypothetical protein